MKKLELFVVVSVLFSTQVKAEEDRMVQVQKVAQQIMTWVCVKFTCTQKLDLPNIHFVDDAKLSAVGVTKRPMPVFIAPNEIYLPENFIFSRVGLVIMAHELIHYVQASMGRNTIGSPCARYVADENEAFQIVAGSEYSVTTQNMSLPIYSCSENGGVVIRYSRPN